MTCLLSCEAFAPGSRKFRFVSVSQQISLSSDYHHGSNHTARDVLDSLDFIANLKNRGDNNTRGVSLFEATREVVEEEEVLLPQTRSSMKATISMDSQVEKEKVVGNENQDFEAVMDADMDALLQMSAWGGKKKEKKLNDDDSSPEKKDAMPGLGGTGGTSYNVNHLKKNLVQEMIERSKAELWNDLGDPSIDFSLVEDKIASLVQSNAVVCTTDSNLLDGKWTFAFGSRQSASALMDPNRFDLAARRTSKTLASKSAKVERPFRSSSRTFYLEDILEDDDAHVLDQTTYFGGLVKKSRRANVTRLTRNSLQLKPSSRAWFLFGTKIRQKHLSDATSQQQVEDLRILYVDNDLCLSASNDLEKSSFYVWTKSRMWTGQSQRMKRNARRLLSGLRRVKNSILNIIFLRKRLQDAVVAKVSSSYGDPLASRILVNIDDGDSKKMTVLKLGDLENDANAWEGEDDPFVHLSADERQEQLKKMRVRDIRRAGRRQRRLKPKKDKGKATPKPFKKPE